MPVRRKEAQIHNQSRISLKNSGVSFQNKEDKIIIVIVFLFYNFLFIFLSFTEPRFLPQFYLFSKYVQLGDETNCVKLRDMTYEVSNIFISYFQEIFYFYVKQKIESIISGYINVTLP